MQYWNKLVRDRIPEIIEQGGEIAKLRKLTVRDFLKKLKDKLIEEAYEAIEARSRKKLLYELVDIEEVIDELLASKKQTRRDLRIAQGFKRIERGGFKKRILLVWTRARS